MPELTICVWNIEDFSARTFTENRGGNKTNYADRYMRAVFRIYKPDIVVIQEVIASTEEHFGLANSGSCQEGLRRLKEILHSEVDLAPWSLVPPLRLDDFIEIKQDREAIAVFYRSDKVSFEGPGIWPDKRSPAPEDWTEIEGEKKLDQISWELLFGRATRGERWFTGAFVDLDAASRTKMRLPWWLKFTFEGKTFHIVSFHNPTNQSMSILHELLRRRKQGRILHDGDIGVDAPVIYAGDFNLKPWGLTDIGSNGEGVVRSDSRKNQLSEVEDEEDLVPVGSKLNVKFTPEYIEAHGGKESPLWRGTNTHGLKMGYPALKSTADRDKLVVRDMLRHKHVRRHYILNQTDHVFAMNFRDARLTTIDPFTPYGIEPIEGFDHVYDAESDTLWDRSRQYWNNVPRDGALSEADAAICHKMMEVAWRKIASVSDHFPMIISIELN